MEFLLLPFETVSIQICFSRHSDLFYQTIHSFDAGTAFTMKTGRKGEQSLVHPIVVAGVVVVGIEITEDLSLEL